MMARRRRRLEGGGTARRGRGRVDGGGEERRPADKAAKPPCRMSLRTRLRLRGRREGNGGARAARRESARLPRPPFAGEGRADSRGARRCEGGRGARGVSEVAGGRRPRHEAGGEGGRPRTRPPRGTSPQWQERGRRDHVPRTRLCSRPREMRLYGQGRQTVVRDVLRTRPRRQGRRGRAPPDARPRNSRRLGRCSLRAEATRTVAGHVAAEEVVGHGEVGKEQLAAGHGRGR